MFSQRTRPESRSFRCIVPATIGILIASLCCGPARSGAGEIDRPALFRQMGRVSGISENLFPNQRRLEDAKPRTREAQDRASESITKADAGVVSFREEFRVYVVGRRDSLWKIAKRFGMQHQTLAKINEVRTGEVLQVGRPLKVKATAPREVALKTSLSSPTKDPSLLEHVKLTDGRPVPRWMVTDFRADVIDRRCPLRKDQEWDIPSNELAIVIHFELVKNPLEGKARQYQSIVLTHAEKYRLDPALVMAMIHTESAFDPNARSPASAYGLMQLVPHTAGQEAYHRIYGQRRKLTPQYLYDPANNIELGTAYLDLLRNAYLGSIADPLSRTYCVVAAYHAGPSTVGRVFLPSPSIKQATHVINSLEPADVYKRLVEELPSIESRNYLRDVIKRIRRYSGWYSTIKGGQT